MVWTILFGILLGLLGLLIAYILLILISCLFADRHKLYDKNSRYFRFLLNSATGMAVKIIRIKLRVTGTEKLPQGRFLFVSNHRSKWKNNPQVLLHGYRPRKSAQGGKNNNSVR